MILAAAQTVPKRGDVDANVAQHLDLARRAADEGAALVLYPELSLTGYELDLAADLAFTHDDPRLDPLREFARESGVTLVVGAPLRHDDKLLLTVLILKPDGGVAHYAKRHLGAFPADVNPGGPVPPPEPSVFAPGTEHPVLELGGRKVAFAICADIGHPQHVADAAARSADTLLASMFFLPQDRETEHGRLSGYAREHEMWVVVGNYGGPTGGLPSGGASGAWSPAGEPIGVLGSSGSGVIVAGS